MNIRSITPSEFQQAAEIVRISFDHRSAQDQGEDGQRIFRAFSSAEAIQKRFEEGCLSLVAEKKVGD